MDRDLFRKNRLSMILLFIGSWLVIYSFSVYSRGNILNLLTNNLYKNDTNRCIQMKTLSLEQLIELSDDTFVAKNLNEIIRGIYFSQKYSYCLPVVEGRFFRASDFKKENCYAVVGQKLKENLYEKNKKKYIKCFGKEYEVIGILGFDTVSLLDHSILINLLSVPSIEDKNSNEEIEEKLLNEKQWSELEIVIGGKYDTVEDRIAKMKLEDVMYTIENVEIRIPSLYRAVDLHKMIATIALISCFLSIIFTFYMKSYYYKIYYRIFHFLGFPSSFFYKRIVLREFVLLSTVFLLGTILSSIYFYYKTGFHIKDIWRF